MQEGEIYVIEDPKSPKLGSLQFFAIWRFAKWNGADFGIEYLNMIILLRFETTTWGFRHTIEEYTPSENRRTLKTAPNGQKQSILFFPLISPHLNSVRVQPIPQYCLILITYP